MQATLNGFGRLHLYMYVHIHIFQFRPAQVTMCMWSSEDKFQDLVLSILWVLRVKLRSLGLCDKCFHLIATIIVNLAQPRLT